MSNNESQTDTVSLTQSQYDTSDGLVFTAANSWNLIDIGHAAVWVAAGAVDDTAAENVKKSAANNSAAFAGVSLVKHFNLTTGLAALGQEFLAAMNSIRKAKVDLAWNQGDEVCTSSAGGFVPIYITSTLTTSLNNSSDATIALNAALSPLPLVGQFIRIGTEIMKIATVTNGASFTVDTTTSRAKQGSTIAAHTGSATPANADTVYLLGTFYVCGRARAAGVLNTLSPVKFESRTRLVA